MTCSTGIRNATMKASGIGSEGGCDYCRASSEPDEGHLASDVYPTFS